MKRILIYLSLFTMALVPRVVAQNACVVNSIQFPNDGTPTDANMTISEAVTLLNNGQCNANIVTFDPSIDGLTINVTSNIQVQNFSGVLRTVDGSGAPNVILSAPNTQHALFVQGGNLTINSVNIEGAQESGIDISAAPNVTISNSSVSNTGTNQDKTNAYWNGLNQAPRQMSFAGINANNSNNITVSGNTIFNNDGHGIRIINSTGGTVSSNTVGFNKTGDLAGNFGDGILLESSSSFIIEGNNSSGNGNFSAFEVAQPELNNENFYGAGISLLMHNFNNISSDNNIIRSNFIGTNADGSSVVVNGDSTGNHKHGIYLSQNASNNSIGQSGAGNIVGGNGFKFLRVLTNNGFNGNAHGMVLDRGASSNTIVSNFIGWYDGNCIANNEDGISFQAYGSSVTGNTIGGVTQDLANIIGGSRTGVFIQGNSPASNLVQGNLIGVSDFNGTPLAGCSTRGEGVIIQGVTGGSTVTDNVISGATKAVFVNNANNVSVTDNVMTCNEFGIDLDNGNQLFGESPGALVAINIGNFKDNIVTGFSPNVNDVIDVYIADSCDVSQDPCQARGVSGPSTGAMGLTFVETISVTSNVDFPDELENGAWTYDLTSSTAVASGVTYDNIIVAARDVTSNTSEFHSCVNRPICDGPNGATLAADDETVCTDDEITLTSTFTTFPGSLDEVSDFVSVLIRVDGTVETAIDSINHTTTGAVDFVGEFASGDYKVLIYNTNDREECQLESSAQVIQVEDPNVAVATVVTPGPFCADQEGVDLSVTGATGSNFVWNVASGGATFNGSNLGSNVTIDLSDQNVTGTVTETTASPFSCEQTPVAFSIDVNALPDALQASGDEDVCAGDVETYIVTGTAGSTYAWDVSATDAVFDNLTTGPSLEITWGQNSGTITVTETNSNGCTANSTIGLPVTVNALPVALSITPTDDQCAGASIEYSVTNTVGSTYEWFQDDVALSSTTNSETVTIPDAATTEIGVVETNSNGCVAADTSKLSVTINARPIITSITPDQNVCLGDDFIVEATSDQANVTFVWTTTPVNADFNTSNGTVSSTAVEDLVISVVATSAEGCTSAALESLSTNVDVKELPVQPTFSPFNNAPACGATITIDVDSPNAASDYVWTYEAVHTGSTPASGDTTAASAGGATLTLDLALNENAVVTVTEISEFGCSSETASEVIRPVGCDPDADFSLDAADYCLGEDIVVTELASYEIANLVDPVDIRIYVITDPNVDSTEFIIPEGGDVTVPGSFFSTLGSGSYDIRMVVEQFGVEVTTIKSSVLVIKPVATITETDIAGPRSLCKETDGSYTLNNTNAESTYDWKSEATTVTETQTSATYNFTTVGINEITVVEDRDGCIDSATVDVDVLDLPNVRTVTASDECQDSTVTISIDGDANGSTFAWTFVDPTNGLPDFNGDTTEAQVTYNTSGTKQVEILETGANGCSSVDSTITVNIEIFMTPVSPEILGDDLVGICGGEDAIFNTNRIAGYTYTWAIDDGSDLRTNTEGDEVTVSSPSSAGSPRTISLTVTSDEGCSSNQTDSLFNVSEIPSAPAFTLDAQHCQDSTATAVITSPNPGSEYTWTLNGVGFEQGFDRNSSPSIDVIVGTTDFTIELVETVDPTGAGCSSATSSAGSSVQLSLGDYNPILEPSAIGECSDAANNVITLSGTWTNATDVTLTSLDIPNLESENEKTLDSLFADFQARQALEQQGMATVTIIAVAGDCDSDSLDVEILIRPSTIVTIGIDDIESCVGLPETFFVSNNVEDSLGTYNWTQNGDTSKVAQDTTAIQYDVVNDEDEIIVIYAPGDDICLDINASTLIDTLTLNAYELPDVDGIVLVNGENTLTTNDAGDEIFSVPNSSDIELQSSLTGGLQDSTDHKYNYYWDFNGTDTTLQITSPTGDFNDEGIAISTAQPLFNGINNERWYFVESYIQSPVSGKICSLLDSMLVVADFPLDPPNFVCTTCEDDTWVIDNLDAFPDAKVTVFNRWGRIVYDPAEGNYAPWDGTVDGNGTEDVPTGTYFYIIEVHDEDNQTFKGPISVLR